MKVWGLVYILADLGKKLDLGSRLKADDRGTTT